MKGLEEYINKYGNHFTEQLALAVTDGRWEGIKVEKAAQKKVYYNVTGSTLGDMVYLTNEVWQNCNFKTIHGVINYVLYIIGDYKYHDGVLFDEWLQEMKKVNADIDLRPYI